MSYSNIVPSHPSRLGSPLPQNDPSVIAKTSKAGPTKVWLSHKIIPSIIK